MDRAAASHAGIVKLYAGSVRIFLREKSLAEQINQKGGGSGAAACAASRPARRAGAVPQQGKLADGEPWLIVNGLLGMCNWIYRWYHAENPTDPAAVKRVFVRMVMQGMVKN